MAVGGMRTAKQLAQAIVERLCEQGKTVTFAESCTGGLTAATLVSVSGASNVFREGYLTYCDESKRDLLGVSQESLTAHTAVSESVALEMADGARVKAKADYAISVTGYADGEVDQAGHVFVGFAGWDEADRDLSYEVLELRLTGDRNTVRKKAVYRALKFLWERL